MEIDLKNISVENLLCNSRLYAVQFTSDELLDALISCNKFDEKRKEAIKKILALQSETSWFISDSNFTLDSILNKFFSKTDSFSIKDNLVRDGVRTEDLESRFKMMLLKACTLVVENKTVSDDIISFFNELDVDINNVYFLNKIKNDLVLEFGYFYDVRINKFVTFSDDDKVDLWRLKIRFEDLLQKRLENSERYLWKDVLSWCSAFWDTMNYKFFWDDVVLYEEWDDFIPIDSFCTIDLDLWCSVDGDMSENLADVDLEEMYNNWDRFIVVKSTYKEKFCIDDTPFYCWFVDVYSVKTKKTYRVLSW